MLEYGAKIKVDFGKTYLKPSKRWSSYISFEKKRFDWWKNKWIEIPCLPCLSVLLLQLKRCSHQLFYFLLFYIIFYLSRYHLSQIFRTLFYISWKQKFCHKFLFYLISKSYMYLDILRSKSKLNSSLNIFFVCRSEGNEGNDVCYY